MKKESQLFGGGAAGNPKLSDNTIQDQSTKKEEVRWLM